MATAPLFQTLIHADWSVSPTKRWAAQAECRNGWVITTVHPVGPIQAFVADLTLQSQRHAVLAGFDFPIGVPEAYGHRTGLSGFKALLQGLGHGRWGRFADVAREPHEISLERPFYPAGATAGIEQADLIAAHQAIDLDRLRRTCERRTADRRAACPLFWTLGGNQVGRAALAGWVEVLQPAVLAGARLWPFDGDLETLGQGPGLVFAETYPAEAYGHAGVSFSAQQSKTRQPDRQTKGPALMAWAERRGVTLAAEVQDLILDCFGSDKAGEDRFDALLGLMGMIEVVSGHRPEGAGPAHLNWEGWILGQSEAAQPAPATLEPNSAASQPQSDERPANELHLGRAIWDDEPDLETAHFVRDLLIVGNAVHQGMPIVGPWMEARLIHMVRQWIKPGWQVSGPAQVCFPHDPDLRTRSWDIVIHTPVGDEYPPEAAPWFGRCLLPASAVRVVIDSKTYFNTPAAYAAQTCFNRMNDSQVRQCDAMGPTITKLILAVASPRGPDSLLAEGQQHGVPTYSMARYTASPVADAEARTVFWKMARLKDGRHPLQAFKQAVLEALE